ncbi:MotA/TolQ/ExbB proton channel family protein [Thiopseudomonas alkaliphila]|uniref:MotA/TolQ/ExbB proton channel family protein n=1 Tax=Thiopseudomonas alkaliphila TaxID=1697053 RepID=A0AAW7DSV5_9GAMM|nr:MotA/TolQ/ExbB proton channel family protein [Thiopseudomonas alkaliphila]MDM1696088.1 MotA/TolQ/ExbB proton channel family protein [Thiopseudomonas alkaliphila]
MKRLVLAVSALLASSLVVAAPLSPEQLLEQIQQTKQHEQQQMQVREQQFIAAKEQQASILAEAKQQLAQLQASSDKLKTTFEHNEQQLAEQAQQLKQQVGELGDVFAAIKQSAGDMSAQWQDSLLNIEYPERIAQLEQLNKTQKVLSPEQIEQYWMLLVQDLTASGQVAQFMAPVIDGQGNKHQQSAVRVGPFSAYSEQGYLSYKAGEQAFELLPRQPQVVKAAQAWKNSQESLAVFPLDPTRGSLVEQLQQQPTLWNRLQHGGLVGWVILTLGAFGLLLAIVRLLQLQAVTRSVQKQMQQLTQPQANNPLGRVLGALGEQPAEQDLETLELKLDEAVMRETPRLERGQGLLKLLAAVAPLLGLLGTVTGMIITFQAITQSGGGDSRLMADGISQALVTTVEGLVVAIPLLFLHSILAARSKGLVQLLEQQSVGLLALHLSGKKSRE